MTCENIRDRLDRYVADALDPAAAGEVASHLAECEECRGDEAAARFLAPRVAALPRTIEPGRSLWHEIAARLKPPRRLALRSWLPLAAALAVISAGAVWLLRPDAEIAGTIRQESSAPQPEGAAYRMAAAELQATLLENGRLTEPTASALRRDVVTLDQAIDETTQALRSDPGNPMLQELHLSSLRRKLETLRRAAALYQEL